MMTETKELKRRVRDIIDPRRNLGHVDSHVKRPASAPPRQVSPDSEQLPPQSSAVASQGVEEDTPLLPKDGDTLHAGNGDVVRAAVEDGPGSSKILIEEVGDNDKVMISSGEGVFFCRPGDEDCG